MISQMKGGCQGKVKDMTKDINEPGKVCPLCNKSYPLEDNYCGSDGSRLQKLHADARSSSAGSQYLKREAEGSVNGEKI